MWLTELAFHKSHSHILSDRIPVHSLKVEEHLAGINHVSQVLLVVEGKHVVDEVLQRRLASELAHFFAIDEVVDEVVVGRDLAQTSSL